jgi:hypothetical protein
MEARATHTVGDVKFYADTAAMLAAARILQTVDVQNILHRIACALEHGRMKDPIAFTLVGAHKDVGTLEALGSLAESLLPFADVAGTVLRQPEPEATAPTQQKPKSSKED